MATKLRDPCIPRAGGRAFDFFAGTGRWPVPLRFPLGGSCAEDRWRRARSPAGWVRSVAAGMALAVNVATAAEPPIRQVSDLKKLSLDELFNQQIVSVSKQPERLAGAASAIQVITQEDIRRSGATSLPEALRLAPNLTVAQVDARQWAISARGFNNTTANKLLVLMDGRAIYTPLFSGVFWDAQDTMLEDIERIEVVSGPGGTLWGANAVNGVINIITKSAKDTQGTLVSGGGGAELNGFGAVRYGGTLGSNVFYRVYGKSFDRDSTRAANGNQGTNAWHLSQGGLRLDWEPSDSHQFTVQGDYYGGAIAQPGLSDILVEGGNLLGRWTRMFSEDSNLKVQFYYDYTRRVIPGTFSEHLGTYDLDVQHQFPVGERQKIVWGAGYRLLDDDVGNTAALAFLPAQVTRQVFSAFAQDSIVLVPERLQLTIGTKVEHNDYTGFELQPSARLAWTPTARETVWAAVSRAVRTPARIDRELFAPGIILGGPNFVSEELLAFELGYRVQPHERVSLSAAAFFNLYDNIRSVEQTAPPAAVPVVLANGFRGETYGVELSGDYRATDWWRLRASYTQLQIHLRPKPGSTDTSKGSSGSHDPNHQLALRSSMELPGRLELDTGLRYVGRIANQSVPSYFELDARLGWKATRNLELSISGQNLLHGHHAEFGAPATRQEIERTIYGKVTWKF